MADPILHLRIQPQWKWRVVQSSRFFFYTFVCQDSELGGAQGDTCRCQDSGTYYIYQNPG